MINTSQHKLRRASNSPETVPYEQKPQVKGHIPGSRAKTRTWNLPVNRRSVLVWERGLCEAFQPAAPA